MINAFPAQLKPLFLEINALRKKGYKPSKILRMEYTGSYKLILKRRKLYPRENREKDVLFHPNEKVPVLAYLYGAGYEVEMKNQHQNKCN